MKKFILCTLMWLWSGMAYATVTCVLPFPNFTPNTVIQSAQVNANNLAIVNCFLNNTAASGNNTDITALLALTIPISAAAGGTTLYIGSADTGSANTYVVASTQPTGFALVRGSSVLFAPNTVNTTASTLAVGGTTATNIFRQSPNGPQALTGGELQPGQLAWAVYDGTQYQLMGSGSQFGGFGPVLGVSAATVTDLGLVPTHNVNISGATPITGFGSSASTSFPVYNLSFAAGVQLTNNATSLILPGGNNITTQVNDTATANYLGSGNWLVSDYSRANGTTVVNSIPNCGFNNLVMSNNAASTINWAYGSAVLISAAGIPVSTLAQSGSIAINVSGMPGGMDGSLPSANTFVFIYAISNGSLWSGLGSLSATGPTLPSGYNYYCYMGAMKTGTSGPSLKRSFQRGSEAHYIVDGTSNPALPTIISGAVGSTCGTVSPTWAAEVVTGSNGATIFAPITAVGIDFVAVSNLVGSGAAEVLIAPNTSYGGVNGSAINPNPALLIADGSTLSSIAVMKRLFLENTNSPPTSSNVAVCITAAAGGIQVYGWKDAVRAD
jgi:hypothetical protein